MTNILALQRLPQIESLDLDPCQLAAATGCELCTHTCCCTTAEN